MLNDSYIYDDQKYSSGDMMFFKFLFVYLSLVVGISAADISSPFKEQEDLNDFCAGTAEVCYGLMNQNVEFSATGNTTESDYWKRAEFLCTSFLVKKRDVPLSVALDDLIRAESHSRFDCTTAQYVVILKILEQYGISAIISALELKDPNFSFPLIMPGILNGIVGYMNRYQFYVGRKFEIPNRGFIENTRDEWNKITNVSSNVDQLPVLTCFSRVEVNNNLPLTTVIGGSLYFPNVTGVKEPWQGENLFRVAKDSYYGFGPLFKDRPKTLYEIGMSLEAHAREEYYGFYEAQLQKFRNQGIVIRDGHHPLEYLIQPSHCHYFGLQEINHAILEMKRSVGIVSAMAPEGEAVKVITSRVPTNEELIRMFFPESTKKVVTSDSVKATPGPAMTDEELVRLFDIGSAGKDGKITSDKKGKSKKKK
ncbi:MAG: hypothetical protein K2Q34_02145 [Alphaproteobacteria bacterium]|nr:hypothetical protein [Alphaproteobacteria bacterium]